VVNAVTADKLELPVSIPNDGAGIIAFSFGRSRAVRRRLEQSSTLLQEHKCGQVERMDARSGSDLLRRLTDLGWSARTTPQLGLKINVPPSALSKAINWPQDSDIGPPSMLADAGFGSMRLFWWDEDALPVSGAIETIARLRVIARGSGGSVVVEHCPPTAKGQVDVWGIPSVEVELMRRIKHTFDPMGTLNPGRSMGRL